MGGIVKDLQTKLTEREQHYGWAVRHKKDLAWVPDSISDDCVGVFQQSPFDSEVGDWLCYIPADTKNLLGLTLALVDDLAEHKLA
jgi:hypothetical protein